MPAFTDPIAHPIQSSIAVSVICLDSISINQVQFIWTKHTHTRTHTHKSSVFEVPIVHHKQRGSASDRICRILPWRLPRRIRSTVTSVSTGWPSLLLILYAKDSISRPPLCHESFVCGSWVLTEADERWGSSCSLRASMRRWFSDGSITSSAGAGGFDACWGADTVTDFRDCASCSRRSHRAFLACCFSAWAFCCCVYSWLQSSNNWGLTSILWISIDIVIFRGMRTHE